MSENNYLEAKNNKYYQFLLSLPPLKFIEIMDLAYAGNEIENKINNNKTLINSIQEQLTQLQQKIKTSTPETKEQIINEIKHLGNQKKELQNSINKLSGRSIPNGLSNIKDKLVNLNARTTYFAHQNEAIFSNYAINVASQDPKLKKLFIKRIPNFYTEPFISDYAKELSKSQREGNTFGKLSTLSSFQNRNLPQTQNVFQNSLLNEHIRSFLGQMPEDISEDVLKNLTMAFKEFALNSNTPITPEELVKYIKEKTKDMNRKNISIEKAKILLKQNKLLGGIKKRKTKRRKNIVKKKSKKANIFKK